MNEGEVVDFVAQLSGKLQEREGLEGVDNGGMRCFHCLVLGRSGMRCHSEGERELLRGTCVSSGDVMLF